MIVLPAIDLQDGKVVRLYKGDFDTVHPVAEDPQRTAAAFADAGARYLHMVDLDGARSGERKNGAIVRAVAERSGLRVELGGGMRSMADLEAADAMGVSRMVIGSAARPRSGFRPRRRGTLWSADRRWDRRPGRHRQDRRMGRVLRAGLFGIRPVYGRYRCKGDYLYRYCHRWNVDGPLL